MNCGVGTDVVGFFETKIRRLTNSIEPGGPVRSLHIHQLLPPLLTFSICLALRAQGGEVPLADPKNAGSVASKAAALLVDEFANFKSIPYIHCTYTKVYYMPFFVFPKPEGFGIKDKQDFWLDSKGRVTKYTFNRDRESLQNSLSLLESDPATSGKAKHVAPIVLGMYQSELRNYEELFTTYSSERFNRDTEILSIRKAGLPGAPKPDPAKPVSLDMQLYKSGKTPPILFPLRFLGRQGNRIDREGFQWHFLLDEPLLLSLIKNSVTKIEEREPGKVQVLHSSVTEEIYAIQKTNKEVKNVLPRGDVGEAAELGMDKKAIEDRLAARQKDQKAADANNENAQQGNMAVLVFFERKEEFGNKWLITKYEMRDRRDDELMYLLTTEYRPETIQGKTYHIPSKISRINQGSMTAIKNNIEWTILLDRVDPEPVDKTVFGIDAESARKIYDENAGLFVEGESGK